MAKGTKYSDVNYSVPEGADPLGIGVPDLGKSSYDPIATIRSGWENSRQERLMDREQDSQDYQSYLKNMPTPDGVNQQITQSLNKSLGKMGALFKRKQEAGGFAGFAKGESGEGITAELSQLENEVATQIPIYNQYSEQYKKDQAVMRSAANKDKIDWDVTMGNVDAMSSAANVEEFAQPFANNGGSLVAFRPEEADMIGWVKKAIETFAPGMDTKTLFNGLDEETGKYKTTTLEYKDQKRVYDGIIKGYKNAKDVVKNQVQRMYDAAPAGQKKDENGVIMEPDAWYASQFAPEYGQKKKDSFTAVKEDKKSKTGVDFGVRDNNGELDLAQMANTRTMKSPRTSTTQSVKRTRKFGKDKGKAVYNDPQVQDVSVDAEYNSVSLPLAGIDDVFELYLDDTFMETQTGKTPEQGRVSTNKPVSLDFMPTWTGAPIKVEIENEPGTDGTTSKNTYTVKPGDRITKEVEAELQNQKQNFSYKPYLISQAIYGATIESTDVGGMTWNQYMSRHGKSTLIPWEKAKRSLYAKMEAEGYKTAEIDKIVSELDKKLNSVESVFN